MSKNSLFCPKKESSITQKVLIEIFFNVIFHLMYMVWLDLDAKSALDTGTPSVEAHKCAVKYVCITTSLLLHGYVTLDVSSKFFLIKNIAIYLYFSNIVS